MAALVLGLGGLYVVGTRAMDYFAEERAKQHQREQQQVQELDPVLSLEQGTAVEVPGVPPRRVRVPVPADQERDYSQDIGLSMRDVDRQLWGVDRPDIDATWRPKVSDVKYEEPQINWRDQRRSLVTFTLDDRDAVEPVANRYNDPFAYQDTTQFVMDGRLTTERTIPPEEEYRENVSMAPLNVSYEVPVDAQMLWQARSVARAKERHWIQDGADRSFGPPLLPRYDVATGTKDQAQDGYYRQKHSGSTWMGARTQEPVYKRNVWRDVDLLT